MRSSLLRKSAAGFLGAILIAPTFFVAFWYEGLHNKAYAQGIGSGLAAGVTGAAKCGAMILIGAGAGVAGSTQPAQAVTSVPTFDLVQQIFQGGITVKEGFLDCLARAIAKAMLRAITQSVVDWINSGFNGNPSFVQDFRGFMLGVADETIGEFIAGSPLSFLCSPFQLRVRIAIAKQFSRRQAPICTLSQITSNIEGFTRDFNQGGWPAFLEFAVNGTNNPFGGHIVAQASLEGEIFKEQDRQRFDLELGRGFFSFEEKYDCELVDVPDTDNAVEQCKTRSTTPGTVIENQLETTLGGNLRELELADTFDEIIDALVSQLLLNVFYGGLGNFGSSNSSYGSNLIFDSGSFGGGTPGEVRGVAEGLVSQIDAATSGEERIRNAKLQSLGAVENAQNGLSSLAACWADKQKNSSLSYDQQAQAKANEENAIQGRLALEPRRIPLQNAVTEKERVIFNLDTFRARAYEATTLGQVDVVSYDFMHSQSATSSGPIAIIDAENETVQVTNDMNQLDQTTNEKLSQCHAFPSNVFVQ